MPPRSASRHYRRLQRLQALTIASVRRAWGRMEPGGQWERQYREDVGPKITAVVVAAQVAATRESDSYVAEVLNELAFGPETKPGVVLPQSLAGVAGDGRPVESLLAMSVGRARASLAVQRDNPETVLGRSISPTPDQATRALDDAQTFLDMVAESIIADANRAAELVAMAQRPWVDGWVRMISPPCCARCALLSGKFYLFNEGFLRHPRCDCYHLPAPSDPDKVRALMDTSSPDRYFESLTAEEQDRIFTKAGARAIREGADIAQVVNARRGMSRAQVGGRSVLTTTEGTTRRGLARAAMVKGSRARLMPESIFEIAGDDRDEAIRLLRLNGYIA